MARKKKTATPVFLGGGCFSNWSTRKLITEAANVARWNPLLGYEWFQQAASEITISEYPLMLFYDKKAKETNQYWRFKEKMRFYDKAEMWSGFQPLTIPLFMED